MMLQEHKVAVSLPRELSHFTFHLKTLYLFVCNYNAIIVIWTLLGAFCGSRLLQRSIPGHEATLSPITRSPLILLWITLTALDFSIANQRLPSSIAEDRLNKPYRPITSRRISPNSASILRIAICLTGFLFSLWTGSQQAFIVHALTTFSYNDLRGSQGLWLVRDIHVGIGMVSWLFGCIRVAAGSKFEYEARDMRAAGLLFVIMASTIAIQDFRDLRGDKVTGRHTLPIAIGEEMARGVVAGFLVVWSLIVPAFWGKEWVMGFVLSILGVVLAVRLMFLRSPNADKRSLEYWYGWFAVLCLVVV
jgi:4-hydroxybenzoate polyprenyltransferase